ncbi:MAG TPA: hypothetical protein VNA16_07080 [Abditibacteriaceae bacterium]|nr:hypothetical protein [Abditibacteriaceae bacterium]
MIQVAAATFEITPRCGSTTDSLVESTTGVVYSSLKVTIILLQDEGAQLCFVTAPFYVDFFPFTNLVRTRLGAALGLKREQIAVFSSHNHSCVMLSHTWPFIYPPQEEAVLTEAQLTLEGAAMLHGLLEAAPRLQQNLQPAAVSWSVGHERRVAYNRKGRRADGSTYLMREEDRVLLGEDFNGDIDDDAPVVAFKNSAGEPICFLTQFTAHPCTAYHPEDPVVFGDFPQVACDDLSEAHHGVPVAFLQGCAGEINSKGFLAEVPSTEKVAKATKYGHYLGETYVAASHDLQPSQRDDLALAWLRVRLPFTAVPAARKLRLDLEEINGFLQRCARGGADTRSCVGLNFPRALSPRYRAKLVAPCKEWTQWALAFHTENRLHEAPRFVEVEIGVFRIGDIGIVGLPCEPFLGIGRQIRAGSTLPLTIPCGYMNDNIAYVPDSPNAGDRDYSSSYYRYTTCFLPFRKPAGDLLARAAVRQLNNMAEAKNG